MFTVRICWCTSSTIKMAKTVLISSALILFKAILPSLRILVAVVKVGICSLRNINSITAVCLLPILQLPVFYSTVAYLEMVFNFNVDRL